MDALPNDPDWAALPEDPQQFFQLPDDFGRVDLRRKYSALIRRFKPEKYPNEFQRIRTAFEELDQQLKRLQRQSEQSKAGPDFQIRWDELSQTHATEPLEPESGSHRQPHQSDTPPRPRDLKTPPQERARPDEERKPFRPPETQRHERRPRVTDTPEQLEQSLRSLAHRLRNDRFYLEAWPLWDQLTELIPFERWQPLLAELSFIVDSDDYNHPPVEKAEFMIRFLRRAVWTASYVWLDSAFGFLDSNADLLREPWEFETLLRLRDYCNERVRFLNNTRGREIIDEALHDYFTKQGEEADNAFRRHQIQLAMHPEWLRESFPLGNDDLSRHWPFWSYISDEVAKRLSCSQSQGPADQCALQRVFEEVAESFRKAIELVTRPYKVPPQSLRRIHYVSMSSRFWNLVGSVMIGGMAFAVLGLINSAICLILGFFLVQFSEYFDLSFHTDRHQLNFSAEPYLLIPPASGAAYAFYIALCRGQLELKAQAMEPLAQPTRPFEREARCNAEMCYEKYLAQLFEDFVRQTGVSFEELVDLSRRELEVTAVTLNQGLPFVRYLHDLLANDDALACFALAQRFVR